MIDGLKLQVRGDDLKSRVEKRIERLERAVERYRKDQEMDPKNQTDEHPWLPDHILESMIDDREERIAALELIRDHLVTDETYLLSEQDLQFAELLPRPDPPELPICRYR